MKSYTVEVLDELHRLGFYPMLEELVISGQITLSASLDTIRNIAEFNRNKGNSPKATAAIIVQALTAVYEFLKNNKETIH